MATLTSTSETSTTTLASTTETTTISGFASADLLGDDELPRQGQE